MFVDFEEKIQHRLVHYLNVKDLRVLSLLSHGHNKAVKQFLFDTIRIPTVDLQEHGFVNDPSLLRKMTNLRYAKVLRINSPFIAQTIFQVVGKLNNLLELNLHESTNVGDSIIPTISSGLTSLKKLNLSNTRVGDQGMEYVKTMKTIEELVLTRCEPTNKGIADIATLPLLTRLDASRVKCVDDATMEHMAMILTLQDLSIRFSKVTDNGLVALTRLPNLKRLDICRCDGITNDGLVHLAQMTALEDLTMRFLKINDAGLLHLYPLENLKRLDVGRIEAISDSGIASLCDMFALEELCLQYCKITDEAVRSVATMLSLKSLDVSRCTNLTPEGMVELGKLVKMEDLCVKFCRLTDVVVEKLSKLPLLKKLDISFCQNLTNDGLVHLKDNKDLEVTFRKLRGMTHEDLDFLQSSSDK